MQPELTVWSTWDTIYPTVSNGLIRKLAHSPRLGAWEKPQQGLWFFKLLLRQALMISSDLNVNLYTLHSTEQSGCPRMYCLDTSSDDHWAYLVVYSLLLLSLFTISVHFWLLEHP